MPSLCGVVHIVGIIVCSILFFCIGLRVALGRGWKEEVDFSNTDDEDKMSIALGLIVSLLLAFIWPITLGILISIIIVYLLVKLIILLLCFLQRK